MACRWIRSADAKRTPGAPMRAQGRSGQATGECGETLQWRRFFRGCQGRDRLAIHFLWMFGE
jgi:hypothetical protein